MQSIASKSADTDAQTFLTAILLLLFSTTSGVTRDFRSTSRVYRVGIRCW